MNKFFLTLGYSGLVSFAPGTVGTLVSLPFGILILIYFDAYTLFLATTLISIIAIKQINKYEELTGTHDDKSIVIDEVVGLWLAFCIASFNPIQILLSFLYFRAFDIYKPSIIGRVDRDVKGGLGVVGDDLLAGFFAGLCSAGSWSIYERFIAPLF